MLQQTVLTYQIGTTKEESIDVHLDVNLGVIWLVRDRIGTAPKLVIFDSMLSRELASVQHTWDQARAAVNIRDDSKLSDLSFLFGTLKGFTVR